MSSGLAIGGRTAVRPRGVATRLASPAATVVALIVVGFLLRLALLGNSLFGDELSSYYVVTGHSLGRVLTLLDGRHIELNPPLYFLLAWTSEKLFGASAQALRLPSLIAGTATIPLTYLLGRMTVGVRAGLAGAALVAFSPFLLFYSSEARPYASLVCLCLLSTVALLRALRSQDWRWWAAYAAFTCAAAYTHFTAVFVLAGQLLWAVVTHRQAVRALVIANAAAVIGYAPWLPTLLRAERSPLTHVYGGLESFTFHAVRTDIGRAALGHPYLALSAVPGEPALGLIVAGLAVALVAGVAVALVGVGSAQRKVSRRPASGISLPVVLACAAPVGIILYSVTRESIWDARDLISSWPGFAVSLGALVTWPRMPWRAAAAALVVAGFALGAAQMLRREHQRPAYGAVASLVDRTSAPGSPVVDWDDVLTPGPLNELEAAFALNGSSGRHPVLRLGSPPLAAVLRASPFSRPATPPGTDIAQQAAQLATRGQLYLVTPAPIPITELQAIRRRHIASRASGALAALATFLGALPTRFLPVTAHSYPGLVNVTAYRFTSSGPPR